MREETIALLAMLAKAFLDIPGLRAGAQILARPRKGFDGVDAIGLPGLPATMSAGSAARDQDSRQCNDE